MQRLCRERSCSYPGRSASLSVQTDAVEQSLRIYQLKYADATGVKDMLEEMFESGKDLPRPAPGSEST